MTQEKKELHDLPSDFWRELIPYLSRQNAWAIRATSKSQFKLFQPIHSELLRTIALKCVVQGRVKELKKILKRHPEILFEKGQVTDPEGKTFYNVSPYQMILFLCDKSMKDQIMSLDSVQALEELAKKRKADCVNMKMGGADLIKLKDKPTVNNFEALTQIKTQITLPNGTQVELSFPLLENPDGLCYYQDEKQTVHFYYANPKTKALKELVIHANTDEDKAQLKDFIASFDKMEFNSGRRSSNAEHALIERVLSCTIQRQGINYEQKGIRYCDNRASFQDLTSAYRTCIRLYKEAETNGEWNKGDQAWCEGVGTAQYHVIWLLQRFCEPDSPFYPLPADFNKFNRTFVYMDLDLKQKPLMFNGCLPNGSIAYLTLCKGYMPKGCAIEKPSANWKNDVSFIQLDLNAVHHFVEDAKTAIISELNQDLDLQSPQP